MNTKPKRCDEAQKLALMLRIARHKDHDAFRELFQDYEQQALALAFHITGRKDLAEDAVQEAMLRIWRLSDSFREDRNGVTPWMARIVARESIKLIAKGQRGKVLETASSELKDSTNRVPSKNGVEIREDVKVLREALSELPHKERRILALRYMGGMNQNEISKLLSIPPRTISLRLKVALEKMKAKLATAGFGATAMVEGSLLAAMQVAIQPSPEWTSRIMEALPTEPGAADISTMRTSSKVLGALIVLSLAFLACGATVWLRSTQVTSEPNRGQQVNRNTPLSSKSDSNMKTTESDTLSIEYSWQAADGPPKDLTLHSGGWTWDPDKRVMKIGRNAVAMVLPLDVTTDPLLVEIRYRHPAISKSWPLGNYSTISSSGIRRIHGSRLWPQGSYDNPSQVQWSQIMHQNQPRDFKKIPSISTFYWMMYGGRIIGSYNRNMNPKTSILECKAPLPPRFRLNLELHNMNLHGIRVISLDLKQIVSSFKDKEWEVLRSKMKLGKTVGWQVLPEAKSKGNAKSTEPFEFEFKAEKKR